MSSSISSQPLPSAGNAAFTFPSPEDYAAFARASKANEGNFMPLFYPFLNMLIRPGSLVTFKNLQSVSGKRLNGKQGTAIDFFPDSGSWSVQVDDKIVKCPIQNIQVCAQNEVFIVFLGPEHPCGGGKDPCLIKAGFLNGNLTLMVTDFPKRPGFDMDAVQKQCLLMGVPPGLIERCSAQHHSLSGQD